MNPLNLSAVFRPLAVQLRLAAGISVLAGLLGYGLLALLASPFVVALRSVVSRAR